MRIPRRRAVRVGGVLLVLAGSGLWAATCREGGGAAWALGLLAASFLVSGAWLVGRIERRRSPSDLQGTSHSLVRALESALVGTWWYDRTTGMVRISPEHARTAGLDVPPGARLELAAYLARHVHPEDREILRAWIEAPPLPPEEGEAPEFAYRVLAGDGEVRHLRAVRVEEEFGWRLVVAQDVSDFRRLEERMLRGVLYDALTGLPNRSLFDDRLQSTIRRAGPPFVGVALLDIDRFLAVNASLGRDSGDALLLSLAVRLLGTLPPGTTVARVGEDEFAALLEVHSLEEAREEAHRMKGALASPLLRGTREVSLTASVGVAVTRREDATAEGLLQKAETALFQARSIGADTVALFDEQKGIAHREEVSLELELRQAASHGELELHFQPVVRLSDLATVGFEALVRWRRPGVGLISPALFIPMAERSGSIHEIGRWVLDEALAVLRGMRIGGRRPTMAINLSARQMEEEDLVSTIRDAMARHDADPRQVILEITESSVAERAADAAQRIAEIRAMGVRVSLDDFGTGFSSLGYLHRFPVDTLKIDKSFVDLLRDDAEDDSPVPRAVVGLARSMGMDVVAEGIERESQLERLRQMGCEYGQGYLFSRPLPRGEAEAWIRDRPAGA